MASIFNSVSIPFRKRNKFNLSYENRLTTEFGRLTPILCQPVLPNDRFKVSTNLRVQFAPMVFPVMQKFTAYIHYFFVPNRLLWDEWEEFITGGEDGLADPDYPVIEWNASFGDVLDDNDENGFMSSSLFDYLGFPASQEIDQTTVQGNKFFDALPFKAYQLIYNEWYRDQNLTDEIEIGTDVSGAQVTDVTYSLQRDLLKLRQRAWRKDYFTSALPDPQRGPDVTLPLVGKYDIQAKDNGYYSVYTGEYQVQDEGGHAVFGGMSWREVQDNSEHDRMVPTAQGELEPDIADPVVLRGTVSKSTIAAGLEAVNNDGEVRSATINEVRRAFAVQRWYELAARAGSRYVEQILAHFGIRSSDARLQRPEYIGGSVVPVYIGDVLQTSETTVDGTPLGTPAGVGQAAGRVKPVVRTFEEHGWLLGILSVIPEASYMQGIPRKFLKRKKFDFAWPLLANLGEQEIQSQELYFDPTATDEVNMAGFGYTPRYAEYKYGSGEVHGDFRANLADFHDARIFDSRPALNTEFIEVNPAVDANNGLNRIFSVRSGMVDHLWVYLYNDIQVRRVLPKYGTPI